MAGEYNAKWSEWMLENTGATASDVLEYGPKIMSEYGFKVFF